MKFQTFSVVVGGKACNARCPFCISHMTVDQGMEMESPEWNLRNFNIAIRLAERNNIDTVILTGKGEPTLFPNDITFALKKLHGHFPLVELQTNGIMLQTGGEQYKRYLTSWYNLGLTTISLSMCHFDNDLNRQIYQPHKKFGTNSEDLIKYLKGIGFTVRVSCIGLKGYIDTCDKLDEMVIWCKVNDVDQLTYRTVAVPQESVSATFKEATKLLVPFVKDIEKIDEHLRKNATPLWRLPYGAVVYDYRGQNLCFSNCLTYWGDDEKDHEEDNSIRQLIFFPDGKIRYDWQHSGAVIL